MASRASRRVRARAGVALGLIGLVGCARGDASVPAPPPGAVAALPAARHDGLFVVTAGGPDRPEPGSPPGRPGSGRERATGDKPLVTLDIEAMRAELRKARGHGLIVHLWATWCGPCLSELPAIDRLATSARARGVKVLSVSLDSDERGIARITSVLRQRAPDLTAAVASFDDPGRFISLFSPSWEGNIPALFAFDAEGRLRGTVIGEVDRLTLDGLLEQVATARAAEPARHTGDPR